MRHHRETRQVKMPYGTELVSTSFKNSILKNSEISVFGTLWA